MIITGGLNGYPVDVENALGRHPAVADCAVFGIEHAKWGEAVHAAVQLRAGCTATEQELIAFAKSELGSVKTPKAVHFYDELPKTRSEEHTSELQSLMRNSYAVFCLKQKNNTQTNKQKPYEDN